MKFIIPQTQQSSQINVNFFLQTNGWISYKRKSHFRSVERFWTHLHIANNEASHHGLCRHQPRSQGFFLMQHNWWLSSPISRSALGKKHTGNKVEWACIIAEFSNSTRTNSFHTVGSSYGTKEELECQRIVCLHS